MPAAEVNHINNEIIKKHGFNEYEWKKLCNLIGREPNINELGVFSVMWSEHCSYKHSRRYLKTLPTESDNILIKAGEENAGVVDIGDGWAIVFKIESHNHPSALEPFQGAATGVGGIIRDIFTMGARPVALMDSLRFGSLEQARVRYLLKGVVHGISHYGNCIGIPTVGGEVYFDPSYDGNPLVNAFCLGVAKHEDIVRAQASGIGNPVYYLGASTGRDGIHGATFASEELSEKSEEDRSAVQVGDPFMEKLLLEACLELLKVEGVIGVQDMGAAGLTCSTCETASRGNVGIEIDVRKVPLRENEMTPYEILLSESQERMLIIIKKGHEKEVEKIFDKWGLSAVQIGEVKEGQQMIVKDNGQIVVDIPAKALTDDAPLYDPKYSEPDYFSKRILGDAKYLNFEDSIEQALIKLIQIPSIASKNWIYRQYDHMVMTNTVTLPGSDAAVIRLKDANKYIAMSTDCNGKFCYLDPYEGTKMAVAESARNVVCSGAKPIAITNNLNFGNPEKPDIYWQFVKSIEGMKESCHIFNTPVTGGNVSFYNETTHGAIYPTPVIGMVGLIEKKEAITSSFFQNVGDWIILLGKLDDYLGASEFWGLYSKENNIIPPSINLSHEKKLQDLLLQMIDKGFINSAHDISEGGLLVSLSESCFIKRNSFLGIDIQIDSDKKPENILFSEVPSRVVISGNQNNYQNVVDFLRQNKFPHYKLGIVCEIPNIKVTINQKTIVDSSVELLYKLWSETIENKLQD